MTEEDLLREDGRRKREGFLQLGKNEGDSWLWVIEGGGREGGVHLGWGRRWRAN